MKNNHGRDVRVDLQIDVSVKLPHIGLRIPAETGMIPSDGQVRNVFLLHIQNCSCIAL